MERAKTHDELFLENEGLRARLDEAEETLRAIRSGEVDALLTEGPEGDHIFTLRGAEQPYRIFVETMGEGAVTLTQDETVLFCNNRFAEILKRPLHRIMGAPFSQFVSPGDRPLFRQILEARDGDRKELMLEAGDGTEVPVYISGRMASFDGTNVICMVVTDLTAQKETYARQARLEAQLRQAHKMEAVGTLAGGIAHDFNNILAAIIGFSEIARDKVPEGSPARSHLERIFAAGIRGRELVKQILAFGRRAEPEKQRLKLARVVKETIKLLRASLPTTIAIRANLQKESRLVLADPTQMQQVLMNLCTNAAHAMRRGGGSISIGLTGFSFSSAEDAPHSTMSPGLYTKLSVTDTGVGMSPETIDHIFDPFFTTKAAGEGTGLGLSVVHGIVASHGGAIIVSSEQGSGSTFAIYLPTLVEEQSQTSADGGSSMPRGHERILFVDDEEDLAAMAHEMLTGLGYHVTAKTGAREALALFRLDPSRFDLVITDQTMPEITGEDLVKEILSISADTPIVMCTGFSHVVDVDKAAAIGIKAFAMKPLTKREIAKTVRKVLDE